LETFSVTQAGRDPRKIHSSYNPEKEAERYVASLRLDSSIECFILLECGLCYVIPFLQKINSKAKIINIHLSDEYLSKNAPPRNLKTAEWSPSSRERLSDFLENEMPDIESGTIKIIEWRPALKIFGGQYLAVLKETAAFIQRRCANKRTVLYFKERWERNTKKNIHLIQKNTGKSRRIDSTFFSPLDTIKKNIVVCASGPLLEDDIALIQEEQSGGECEIIAVSSALGALYARNIIPDIAITSDGGNWARFHLYEIMRLSKKPVVLASLNAALLSDFSALPLYLFSDGSAEQNALLQNSSRLCFALPARGTVSANAIDFAIMRTKGNIYITGLDLKNNDIASHARPYAFDIFLWEGANRFKPAYSLHYKRTKDAENGKTYTIYRDWFKNETAKYPPRIFFLSNKKTKWGVR
jgi:hypothetical protein